jgi:hypothetical protein
MQSNATRASDTATAGALSNERPHRDVAYGRFWHARDESACPQRVTLLRTLSVCWRKPDLKRAI